MWGEGGEKQQKQAAEQQYFLKINWWWFSYWYGIAIYWYMKFGRTIWIIMPVAHLGGLLTFVTKWPMLWSTWDPVDKHLSPSFFYTENRTGTNWHGLQKNKHATLQNKGTEWMYKLKQHRVSTQVLPQDLGNLRGIVITAFWNVEKTKNKELIWVSINKKESTWPWRG